MKIMGTIAGIAHDPNDLIPDHGNNGVIGDNPTTGATGINEISGGGGLTAHGLSFGQRKGHRGQGPRGQEQREEGF
jgi:hypothetical protein